MVSQSDTNQAEYWIDTLELLHHPEGGWYRETYRSRELIPHSALPDRFSGNRSFSTAIYFLLKAGEISKLHRIRSDEIWHFYFGVSLAIHVIDTHGTYRELPLGQNVQRGESFQLTVEQGAWFGATVNASEGFSLVGCSVAPGFDFSDFELAQQEKLLSVFPQHRDIIQRLS